MGSRARGFGSYHPLSHIAVVASLLSAQRIIGHTEIGKFGPESFDASDTCRLITAVRNVKVQTITKLNFPEQAMTRYKHLSSGHLPLFGFELIIVGRF